MAIKIRPETKKLHTPRWFERHRREWIWDMLQVYGFINREHLVRKFGISVPQASIDLRLFRRRYPYAMIYDTSRKCYLRAES